MLVDGFQKPKLEGNIFPEGLINAFFSISTGVKFWLKQMKLAFINLQKTKGKNITAFFLLLICQCVSNIIYPQPCSLSCVTTYFVTNMLPGSCMAIVHLGH